MSFLLSMLLLIVEPNELSSFLKKPSFNLQTVLASFTTQWTGSKVAYSHFFATISRPTKFGELNALGLADTGKDFGDKRTERTIAFSK